MVATPKLIMPENMCTSAVSKLTIREEACKHTLERKTPCSLVPTIVEPEFYPVITYNSIYEDCFYINIWVIITYNILKACLYL